MRVTQGCFSYLPDLSDADIRTQVQYCIDKGWAVNIAIHRRPTHPRNTYWEMWGLPMFDIKDAAAVMLELDCLPQGACEPQIYSASPASTLHMAGKASASPSSSAGPRKSRGSS